MTQVGLVSDPAWVEQPEIHTTMLIFTLLGRVGLVIKDLKIEIRLG